MKRVEIPIRERKVTTNEVESLINGANKYLNSDINKHNANNNVSSVFICQKGSYAGLTYNEIINEIYNKFDNHYKLTKEDLIYLYNIYNMPYKSDQSLINKQTIVLMSRNKILDMATIFECSIDKIATHENQIREGEYIVLLNDLGTNVLNNVDELRYVSGDIYAKYVNDVNFPNLESIGGSACFRDINSIGNLGKLRSIGGDADFNNILYAISLSNLEIIGGDAWFPLLCSTFELNNLRYIGKTAYFESLEHASELTNLQYIGRDAYFTKIKTSVGLEKLENISKVADFSSLRDIIGLNSLTNAGYIVISSLNKHDQKVLKKQLNY